MKNLIKINNTIGTLENQTSLLHIMEQLASNTSSSNNNKATTQKNENTDEETEKDTIVVSINSNGGDVQEAFNIYNFLKSTGKKIHTHCQGSCNSAATIIFLAGDKRTASCNIGIHNPFMQNVSGDSLELANQSEYVAQVTTDVCKFYSEKTGLPLQGISALMTNCTVMTPLQAVKLGFATTATQNKDLIISNTNDENTFNNVSNIINNLKTQNKLNKPTNKKNSNTMKNTNLKTNSNFNFNTMRNTKFYQPNKQNPLLTTLTNFMKKLKSPVALQTTDNKQKALQEALQKRFATKQLDDQTEDQFMKNLKDKFEGQLGGQLGGQFRTQEEILNEIDKIAFLLQLLQSENTHNRTKNTITEFDEDEENYAKADDNNNNNNGNNDGNYDENYDEGTICRELETMITTLITELTEIVQQQQQKIDELVNEVTEKEIQIQKGETVLNTLNIVGGAEKVLAMFSSNYQPQTRKSVHQSSKNCPLQERIKRLKNKK